MQEKEILNAETKPITEGQIEYVLTDEHIGVMARKKALQYAYANEYSYDELVKAIIEGAKWARENSVVKK